MKTIPVRLGALLTGLLIAGTARAESSFSYAFGQDVYNVAPGESFNVDVFLQETVAGNDVSRLATEGLDGAGVRVRFDVSPGPGGAAQVLSASDVLPNTADFGDPLFLFINLEPGSHAEFTEFVDVFDGGPPVFGTMTAPETYRVFLGSFRFTAGLVPGETTTIRALDVPMTDDTITDAGVVLDDRIQAADALVRINAVPEPAALTLLATGVLGLLGYGRARRGPARRAIPCSVVQRKSAS